ncbi:preprotein translocase subunit Sec61beta [Candidatus Pacearchaeota archaeon]|nr:preprotein translocase subunit Sec61beta [Candidatus Pacearchaeota archaeon]
MAGEMTVPGMGGGLMRYNEEYDSRFKFGPGVVIGMIIVVIIFVIGLRFFIK